MLKCNITIHPKMLKFKIIIFPKLLKFNIMIYQTSTIAIFQRSKAAQGHFALGGILCMYVFDQQIGLAWKQINEFNCNCSLGKIPPEK